MKKTVIEWAINEIRNNWYDYEYGDLSMDDLIKKAKKKEKSQIKKVFKDACSHARRYASFDSSIEAEDYYLEKYTNEIPDYFKKFNR